MDNLNDLLARGDRTQHVLANGPLPDLINKGFNHIQRDISFQQSHPHFAQGCVDVAFLQRAAAFQAIENIAKPASQSVKHARSRWFMRFIHAALRPCSNPRGRTEPAKVSWLNWPGGGRQVIETGLWVKSGDRASCRSTLSGLVQPHQIAGKIIGHEGVKIGDCFANTNGMDRQAKTLG